MKDKCSIEGCKRKIGFKKHKLCASHYMRYWRYGSPGSAHFRTKKIIKPYKGETNDKK